MVWCNKETLCWLGIPCQLQLGAKQAEESTHNDEDKADESSQNQNEAEETVNKILPGSVNPWQHVMSENIVTRFFRSLLWLWSSPSFSTSSSRRDWIRTLLCCQTSPGSPPGTCLCSWGRRRRLPWGRPSPAPAPPPTPRSGFCWPYSPRPGTPWPGRPSGGPGARGWWGTRGSSWSSCLAGTLTLLHT